MTYPKREHKAHETIWLQVDPDGESFDPEQWGLEDDATWCKDQINSNDVKYIRADKFEELEAKIIAQQARVEQLSEIAGKLLADAMDECVANGATSVSMPDTYVEYAVAISTPDDLSALRAHDEKLLATTTLAAKDVLAERERQKSVEGWTPEHDDQHRKGALASAGGCYALFADYYLAEGHPPEFWPWDAKWWKPSLARRNLIKAGALIIAEIERLDRAEAIEKGGE